MGHRIKELVFIDIETTALTGPGLREDAVIEIAAARIDLSTRAVLDTFETLIRPSGAQALYSGIGTGPAKTWTLGEYHTKAGNFAKEDFDKGLKLSHALDILAGRFLTDGATVSGWNPQFDLDHIKRDFAALHMPFPKIDYHVPDLCSPALFLVLAGKAESMSLRNVIPWAYADRDRKQTHRAMQDVKDSIRVFWNMADYFTKGWDPIPHPYHYELSWK